MSKQEALIYAVIATDVALFRIRDEELEVLLIPVVNPHYKGLKGLPGGLITKEETADTAAARHLKDKGGVKKAFLEQLYTFSDVNRDKRSRVVSVAYLGLIHDQGSTKGAEAVWVPVSEVGTLAYDHNEILLTALRRLRSKLGYTTIIRHLLPKQFTLGELQSAYELILNTELDKRNFRKKIVSLGLVTDTGEVQSGQSHRPAALYQWATDDVNVGSIL